MADPIVETAYGRVQGLEHEGVNTFLGIPYGGSTGGENRFKRPKPPTPWTGVRDATKPGPSAPATGMPQPQEAAAGAVPANLAPAVSEDCLTINIWTPTLDQSRKLPVIFVMPHYAMGTAMGDLSSLAAGGEAVAVSFSHRGGITGHLFLADIGGDEYAESGNAGTLDIVLALQWIRDNISNFGGDPSRVMAYGCSGQASEIVITAGVPEAEGLIQRALISDGFLRGLEPLFATLAADRVLHRLGIGRHELHKLHEVPWQQLHEAAAFPTDLATSLTKPLPFQSYWQFYPVIDGVVLPEAPFSNGCPAPSANVPMMFGWDLDTLDMINSTRPWVGRLDEIGLRIIARNHLGDEMAEEILAVERRLHPDATPTDLAMSVINHRTMFAYWVDTLENRVNGATAPTWAYRWDYKASLPNGRQSAIHGGEFAFFLDTVDRGAFNSAMFADVYAGKEGKYELRDILHESFLRFAHEGDPGTKALPAWPTYDIEDRSVMLLDWPCQVENDPEAELRELYAKVDPVSGPGDYERALIREGFLD